MHSNTALFFDFGCHRVKNSATPPIAHIIAPGSTHHITQRGNNRTQVFFDNEDRQTGPYLLAKYARPYPLQI
jgi:putative transposase